MRSITGIGDEFEILLMTNADGLDVMTVQVEHHAGETIAATVIEEIRTRCEVRAADRRCWRLARCREPNSGPARVRVRRENRRKPAPWLLLAR